MNLEAIEQRCLKYLKESSNPLVPVSTLLRQLEAEGGLQDLSVPDFVTFLRTHELFRVIEPAGMAADDGTAEQLAADGFNVEPMVVLATREPTAKDLAEQLDAQFGRMLSALETAQKEAEKAGMAERVREVSKLRDRTAKLQQRIREFF